MDKVKKVFCLIAVLIIGLVFGGVVSAENVSEDLTKNVADADIQTVVIDDAMNIEFADQYANLVRLTNTRLNVLFFSQLDPQWKDDLMGSSGQTIGQIGCAMTCTAMLLKYYGVNTDPGVLNAWLSTHGGYTSSGALYWAKPAEYSNGKMQFVSMGGSITDNDNWGVLNDELSKGYPVIVEVDAYPSTPSLDSHWVLVTGREGNQYYINDPWDLSYSDKLLSHYYDSIYDNTFFGWRVYHGASTAYPNPTISVSENKNKIDVGETDWVKFTVKNDGTEYTDEWGIQVRVGDGLELEQHSSYPWNDKECNDKAVEWYKFSRLNPGDSAYIWVGIKGKSASSYESVWYTAWMYDPDGQPEQIQYANPVYEVPCNREYEEYWVEVTQPNQPPTLSSGYVTPSSGDTPTIFNYYVTYTDSDGDAPTTKYVYVDGSPRTMTKVSGSYTSGATFKYSTTLSTGSHNYYFYFNDGHGHTKRLPTSGTYSGPSVSLPNQAPTLSSGYVTPSSGDTSTTFNYYVTYTDPDGDAPTTKYVYVDGSPHTMTKISGSYTSSATFKYSTTLSAGSHNYYFYFNDGHGHTKRLPTSGTYSGPSVSLPNQPPTLSSGYVTPTSGDTSTTFNYYVTYTDSDGDAPTTKYVYVDGSTHTMTKISGSYASGATFKYSTTLSAGIHNYYFYFNDGHGHTKRLPTSGTYSGPSVSPPTPTRPDLVITDIYPDTIYGDVGVPIDVRVTVTNQGLDAAGSFYVDVYKNLDKPPTPVFGDVYMDVSGLPAGASTDVVLKVTY